MIWLCRHGETVCNVEGRFNGRIDSPLTARGEDQARRLGTLFKALAGGVGGDWVLEPSSAGRARRTASLIAEVSGIAVRPGEGDPRLAEWDFGPLEAMTRDEIRAVRPDIAAFDKLLLRYPEGESVESFSGRVRAWMDEADPAPEHRIAVAHAGSGRMMRGLYLGLTVDELRELETAQGVAYRFMDGRIERYEAPGAS